MHLQTNLGWLLIVLGLFLLLIGVALVFLQSFTQMGRLPGDIVYEGKHVRVYFPLMTCLLISLAFTALLWLVQYLVRR
ncbi:MAG: DUF2905 domain-containing protein [Gemmataceae bacterium]